MKLNNMIFRLALLIFVCSACARDYDAPPLTAPEYNGPAANTTIAKIKELYADISDPTLVEAGYIIKAYVTGNDVSGNIYKQLYIQDTSGGINIGIDQNSIYTTYRVGQEVYINLQGLYIVKYGGELQIGYASTGANRIPWEMFGYYVSRNGWPEAGNVVPTTVKLSALDASMVNTLVKLENVYFPDGGKVKFSESDKTTNRTLKDGNGNSIDVRNSNYANFAADTLPAGGGTVVGVLSRYNSGWQFYLRSKDDCINFGQKLPGEDDDDDKDVVTYYKETFGTGDVSAKPFLKDYTGYDDKKVTYSDPSGKVSVRSVKFFDTPHLWFPAGQDAYLVIDGIDTSAATETLTLSYDLMLGSYNAGETMNTNAMAVNVDGTEMPVPDQEVTLSSDSDPNKNKVFTISLSGVPAKAGLTVKFTGLKDKNAHGMRLDNISITNKKNVIVITPNP